MTKPMPKKKLVKMLEAAGFTMRQGKGDHEIWKNGEETVVITDTKEISSGLTRQALKAIERVAK